MRRNNQEAVLQQSVKTLLTSCGYTVIEIGKARSKVICPNCKTWHHSRGWQGNTVGAPDLYIHKKEWGPISVGIELKTKTGGVRKEQQELASNNLTVICRSIEEVVEAVRAVDTKLNMESKLDKVKWLTSSIAL
jgi:predicted RNA-binding Zn-ribbon protein involved in translation (DUF1610 family)